MEKKELQTETTLGEKRVRTNFNVSGKGSVDAIKQETAILINQCEEMRTESETLPQEKARLISLAQTAFEEAAMWAVKAATF